MGEFFFSWLVVSVSLLVTMYLYSRMAFFQTLYKTLSLETNELKEMIEEDRVTIELYEFDISKHINNIEFLQKDMVETQVYLKESKNKNTRLRNEVAASYIKIEEMKKKLESLF